MIYVALVSPMLPLKHFQTNRVSMDHTTTFQLPVRTTHALIAVALIALATLPLHAQDDGQDAPADADDAVGQMSFSDLQSQANTLLAAGNLVEAKPIIEELIRRFEHVEETDENVDLSGPTFMMAQASALDYQRTGSPASLGEALKWYSRFIEKYPDHENVSEALEAKSSILAETGKLDEAAEIMRQLLEPPHNQRLPRERLLTILHNLVRIHYSQEKFEEGLPWFEQMIEYGETDPEKQAYAAAAAFEAYMATGEIDKAMALLPLLSKETDVRYRPRLNIAFLRASDQLVGTGRYGDAALVLGLTLTTAEMRAHYEQRQETLTRQIDRLEADDESSPQLNDLKFELRTVKNLLSVLEEVPPLSTDLLVRKARNYVQTARNYEAFWLFYRLMRENPEDDKIEFLTYAAFSNANSLGKDAIAQEIGQSYLDRFPNGNYLEDVVLVMLPSFRKTDPERFVKFSKNYLDQYQDSVNAPAVLAQYAQYLIENQMFAALDSEFADIERKNPGSYLSDGLSYWRGLADLIQRNYDTAYQHFADIIEKFPNSSYAPEALFRQGVIHFAREEFNESSSKLSQYIEEFPDDPNRDQAFYFLAQIAKLDNDTDRAIDLYRQSMDATESMEMVDILTFELSDLLADAGQPDEAIAVINDYMRRHPEEGDLSNCYLRLGKAHAAKRDMQAAIDAYETGIREFAGVREDTGVDDILLDYAPLIERARETLDASVTFLEKLATDPAFLRKMVTDRGELFDYFYNHPDVDQRLYDLFRTNPEFGANLIEDPAPLNQLLADRREALRIVTEKNPNEFLLRQLGEAKGAGDFIKEIRMAMALDVAGQRAEISREIQPDDFQGMTPSTLFFAAKFARLAGHPETARQGWNMLIEQFPLDDKAINAHFSLADLDREAGDYEAALAHYRAVHEEFPAAGEAPIAMLQEAGLLNELDRHEDARQLYERILRVPNWRGPLHARALYEIGKTFEAEGRMGEARGFYERVYLGYQHFSEWASKSYLADAQILFDMNQIADARRVLTEAEEKLGDNAPPEVRRQMEELSARF